MKILNVTDGPNIHKSRTNVRVREVDKYRGECPWKEKRETGKVKMFGSGMGKKGGNARTRRRWFAELYVE
jgi:hypothetical protein